LLRALLCLGGGRGRIGSSSGGGSSGGLGGTLAPLGPNLLQLCCFEIALGHQTLERLELTFL